MEVANKRRGRLIYQAADRQRFAELIRQFGARGAREALSRKVGHGTLLKIAEEFGISLKKGRRPQSDSKEVRPGKMAA